MKNIMLILLITSSLLRGTDLDLKYSLYVSDSDKQMTFFDNNTKQSMNELNLEYGMYSLMNKSDMQKILKWKKLSEIECVNTTTIEYEKIYIDKWKTKTIIKHKYNLFTRILIIGGSIAIGVITGYVIGVYQKL